MSNANPRTDIATVHEVTAINQQQMQALADQLLPRWPKDLNRQTALDVARVALAYNLDPFMDELIPYQGKPYVTISGRIRVADNHPAFDGYDPAPDRHHLCERRRGSMDSILPSDHPEKLIARFWSRVDLRGPDDCWEWTASRTKAGYGHMRCGERNQYAHRISYVLAYGMIPAGEHVCHRCDNPGCVNPGHLFAGSAADNMHDRDAKGRHWVPVGVATYSSKLTEHDVREMRRRYARWGRGGETMQQLADAFGVRSCTVYAVISRKTWRHVE